MTGLLDIGMAARGSAWQSFDDPEDGNRYVLG